MQDIEANLKNLGDDLQSKDPDVVPPSFQISMPSAPIFERMDLNENAFVDDQFNELRDIEKLSKDIETAYSFIPFFYSYRSISRALGSHPGRTKDDPETPGLFEQALKGVAKLEPINEIFKTLFLPRFEILVRMQTFFQESSRRVIGIIQNFKGTPSDVFFDKLVTYLEVVFNIEQLKLGKSGLVNDFMYFKRNKKYLQENPDMAETVNSLQIYLATRYQIFNDMHAAAFDGTTKGGGKPKETYAKQFFMQFLAYCVQRYHSTFILPKQRDALVIACFCVFLIHGDSKSETNNIFSCDKGLITSVFQLFQDDAIIPLYGETSFAPTFEISSCQGYTKGKPIPLPSNVEELRQLESRYLVKGRIEHFQELYRKSLPVANKIIREGEMDEDGLLKLLSCLSEMTSAIMKQFAFKMIILAPTPPDNPVVSAYDRGVRLNYNDDDKNALIELIGYIKSLSCRIMTAQPSISKYIYTQVSAVVQEFIQNCLERPLVRATTAGDRESARVLANIRFIFGEWEPGSEPNRHLPKKPKQLTLHKIKPSVASVSLHQLDVLRSVMSAIIDPKSKYVAKVGAFRFSHFRPKHVGLTQKFLQESSLWYYLLDYTAQIRDNTNLGSLWYRETNLDLEKSVQFPVRSSMPFILLEHLLKSADKPALHDSMLFPFEIYNDAAYMAINTFNSQYLYNEVEAEVALCVDMIAFTFADTFYKFCREYSAGMELPPERIGDVVATPMRYNVVIRQNKVTLLGSAVDFNQVATEKLNAKLLKELTLYVDMLTDLRVAPFVAHLVRVAKTTHSLLLEYGLQMDDFRSLWDQAKGFESPLSLESDMATKIANLFDVGHYKFNCLTRRFICTKDCKITPPTTEQWSTVYAHLHEKDCGYIGSEHFSALEELMTAGEMSWIVQGLLARVEIELIKAVDIYANVASVLRMLPAISKDELLGYFNFCSDAYSGISHKLLGTLFNSLRNIGNLIAVIYLIDLDSPPSQKGTSLMAPLFNRIGKAIADQAQLFIPENGLDLESVITHRSFASLWTVLEFIYCSPSPVVLGEGGAPLLPMDTFGDGPLIAAHTMITLCGQEHLYEFDSMVQRAYALDQTEQSKHSRNENMSRFLYASKIVQQARDFAGYLAQPFKLNFTPVDE